MSSAYQRRLPLLMLLKLAWRNLWRHRKRTLITLSSIAIGFALAVLSIGIGDGSHNSLIRNAINLVEGHLSIQPRGYLAAPANHKYIENGAVILQQLQTLHIPANIQPRISLQILASTASNSTGAALEGLGSLQDPRVTTLRPMLVQGQWFAPHDHRGIVIGSGMARKLKAKIGGKIVIMAGKKGGDSQARLARVRGIFHSGIAEMDNFLVLSNILFTRHFLQGEGADINKQPVTRIAIFLHDPDSLQRWQQILQHQIDNDTIVTRNWQEIMPQLVQFIAIDNAGNYIFLSFILILVIFGVLNTVLMSVLERTREFGLLRALGLSRYHLLLLVFCESFLLGLLAIAAGWVCGGGVHLWFSQHGVDFTAIAGQGSNVMMGTFMDPVVYTELSWQRVIQLTSIIFVATLASGIYPAIKATRVTPVQALRT